MQTSYIQKQKELEITCVAAETVISNSFCFFNDENYDRLCDNGSHKINGTFHTLWFGIQCYFNNEENKIRQKNKERWAIVLIFWNSLSYPLYKYDYYL